ncbi:PLC-like phosphodiesterase [Mytilinidion resinicola]|uniref:Phosphoinositide phospholipase C n=1 Tax=Mytilinidion resinicola TaxID=574789 RepID=A0A6A6YI91_9PEZI|nr:PLC-like phosphodiesterase [Mytilinidion resinicola]KAF2808556.1 PLC-like phosphodiesterase [Mytilinidion resinicola]
MASSSPSKIPAPKPAEAKMPTIAAPDTAQPELQAGGGTPANTSPDANAVEYLSPVLTKHMKAVYEELEKTHSLATKDGFLKWLAESQHVVPQGIEVSTNGSSFSQFAKYLSSSATNAMGPAAIVDCSYPISNYFISSSHNTYLTGNQLSSEASGEAYQNVLLRGCRCVEIDVWDGESPSSSSSEDESAKGPKPKKKEKVEKVERKLMKKLELRFGRKSDRSPSKGAHDAHPVSKASPEDKVTPWKSTSSSIRAEPRVLHGYTLTKETPFRDVCKSIRDYAFVASDLPVIVSLEVHTSLEQQEIMVEIMEEYWKGMLVDLPITSCESTEELVLPRLDQLRNKILIKVKYTAPKPLDAEPPKPTNLQLEKSKSSSALSSSSASSYDVPETVAKPAAPKAKILEALGRLGIYTRSYHFKNFDQPEAKIPTHVFSLSEKTLMEVHEQTPTQLFAHNKNFFMRAYPKGLRLNSSNLDPSIFWRTGVQIVALNWQKWDAGMMLNEAMFSGYNGWVLKPEGYRSASTAENQALATTHHNLDLTIEFFGGQDIPLPPEEHNPKSFKPYVKCELHVEKHEERSDEPIPGGGKSKGGGDYKRRTKTTKTPDPDFQRETIRFSNVRGVTEELTFVRLKVMDDEHFNDDLAAWACFRLDRFQPGLRMIHLYDAHGVLTKGVLFVRIEKSVSA